MIRHLTHEISQIKPGQRIHIDRDLLAEIQPIPMVGLFGPVWNAGEQIMEAIVGSSYEFRFWTEPMTGNLTFERLTEPLTDGRRTFVSPDQRNRFKVTADGLYEFAG